jgi:hypothetical protein
MASTLDAAPALVRFAASGAAAVFAARTARTLLLPLRGGAARYYHASAAAAAGSGAATVKPSIVLVKVGDSGEWSPFEHDMLLGMHRTKLLKALKADEVFGVKLKDIDLSGCTVVAVKSELVAKGAEPEAAHEKDGHVVAMKLDKTVGGLAADAHASGVPLFVRVRLPRGAATNG